MKRNYRRRQLYRHHRHTISPEVCHTKCTISGEIAVTEQELSFVKKFNKYGGLITLCAAAVSFILNFFAYVFLRGRYDYLQIDPSYIDLAANNIVYCILFYASISFIYLGINFVPYRIIVRKESVLKRTIKLMSVILVVALIIACILFVPIITDNNFGILEALMYAEIRNSMFGYSLVLSGLALVMGIAFGVAEVLFSKIVTRITTTHSSIRTNGYVLKTFSMIVPLLLSIAICTTGCYWLGRSLTQDLTELQLHSIVECEPNEYKVVLCQGDNFLLVANCDITKNADGESMLIIHCGFQTEIEKQNSRIIRTKFDQIELKQDVDLLAIISKSLEK